MEQQRDEQLWQIAKKRAGFQRSLVSYFVINGLLWFIWWFTVGRRGINRDMPWPVWSMLGWGIGLLFQYLNAYGGAKQDLVEKEYKKLKNKG
ncbi:MAG: 2TM domain-containing protein [Ferruginibacter sp.]|nr:2TM domain-containing protein [Ferruginibacter sp.]